MSFVNAEVDLEALPRFDDVQFRRVHARYPLIVLAVVIAFELVALLVPAVIVLASPGARAASTSLPGVFVPLGVLLLAAALAWYAHKAASVIRYAVRDHDVIVHSGVFWKREIIQPIARIQHVEQVQGPVVRRFNLARIKLFSAGTGHAAFEIPGLETQTAARIRESILSLRDSRLRAPSQPGSTPETATEPREGTEAREGTRHADDRAPDGA